MPWHALMQLDGLEPFPPITAAAAAHAASAPSWEPPHRPSTGAPTATAAAAAAAGGPGAGQGAAGGEQGSQQGLPVRWEHVDLAGLLHEFCAKQQRHYLVGFGAGRFALIAMCKKKVYYHSLSAS